MSDLVSTVLRQYEMFTSALNGHYALAGADRHAAGRLAATFVDGAALSVTTHFAPLMVEVSVERAAELQSVQDSLIRTLSAIVASNVVQAGRKSREPANGAPGLSDSMSGAFETLANRKTQRQAYRIADQSGRVLDSGLLVRNVVAAAVMGDVNV